MLNDYYQNIGLRGFLQRYGFVNALRRGLFMLCPVHYIKDYEIRKVLWQEKASLGVKKYLKYKNDDVEGLVFPHKDVADPFWIYWNSGIDQVPPIVKKCYESIQRHVNGNVILLTDDNLAEYVQLPDYIEKKKEIGKIPMAGYVDLLRFALLQHYGGTWIDSTVYLTDRIPQSILNSDFFVFRNSLLLIDNPVLYPSWFLHSKKENKTMTEIRNVAFAYWEKNRYVAEYLPPNLIITQVLKENPDIEKTMPYMNSDYSEYLIKVLADEYSESKYVWIKKLTPIHKLTYKLDLDIDKEGSFYRHVMSEL